MRVTIYSWDLDVVRHGGWAISMREYAELMTDHGWTVRFVHSRVDNVRRRGTPEGGPALRWSDVADADLVWAYDSANSQLEIIDWLAGRKPTAVVWSLGDLTPFKTYLGRPRTWVMTSSPTLAAHVARAGVPGRERLAVLPRGRRWASYTTPASWPRDHIGLGFGIKPIIRGDGTRDDGNPANHNPFPRFANYYQGIGPQKSGLEVAWSSIDVAREVCKQTGMKALVPGTARAQYSQYPWITTMPQLAPFAMGDYYSRCRCVLLSHLWESFGATMLEAQYFGCPVAYLREPDVAEPQFSYSGLGYTTLNGNRSRVSEPF